MRSYISYRPILLKFIHDSLIYHCYSTRDWLRGCHCMISCNYSQSSCRTLFCRCFMFLHYEIYFFNMLVDTYSYISKARCFNTTLYVLAFSKQFHLVHRCINLMRIDSKWSKTSSHYQRPNMLYATVWGYYDYYTPYWFLSSLCLTKRSIWNLFSRHRRGVLWPNRREEFMDTNK